MSLPVAVLPSGIAAAGTPATATIPANSSVLAAAGPVGVLADVVQFPVPAVGAWIAGSSRVSIMGMPAIHQASTGSATPPPPAPPLPMTLTQGDARVKAM
jgi:hypothetical protein